MAAAMCRGERGFRLIIGLIHCMLWYDGATLKLHVHVGIYKYMFVCIHICQAKSLL